MRAAVLCIGQRPSVPNENSVQPVADVVPPWRTAKLRQFSNLLESGERDLRMHVCNGTQFGRRFSEDRAVEARSTVESGSSGGSSFVAVV